MRQHQPAGDRGQLKARGRCAGRPIYPVISRKCTRTLESMAHMGRFIDPDRVVQISGVGHFSFNSLNKFIWFRENHPELIDRARRFVFVSSLIAHRLTGHFALDATLVGTPSLRFLAQAPPRPGRFCRPAPGRF
ncbi:FGGY family carbohydrate kinase [Tropicimonas sp. TH_r6]|uniref:FGGY family carbohydrate kinase n=1 Tax=Tropicimonas sp. TH_r6 TaxID=3082085 RepID=UPI0029538D9C|nr:FGGY family carbohydrate kinase [Tropicimonas sp. TH_r6]MDV7142553.1 FGGY family carbohydrate kinase [Tropicimonas sp. TH_r6]